MGRVQIFVHDFLYNGDRKEVDEMENMKEKIEIGLDEEGKVVVKSDVKTMDFLKKAIRAIQIAVFDQLVKEGHNKSLMEMIILADTVMKEALGDNKHA